MRCISLYISVYYTAIFSLFFPCVVYPPPHFLYLAFPIFKCQVIRLFVASEHIFARRRNNNNILYLIATANRQSDAHGKISGTSNNKEQPARILCIIFFFRWCVSLYIYFFQFGADIFRAVNVGGIKKIPGDMCELNYEYGR